jgi:hypothetical protein
MDQAMAQAWMTIATPVGSFHLFSSLKTVMLA